MEEHAKRKQKMKLGIIINTNDSETVWSAFRFANLSLRTKHNVRIFLINKGVEIEKIMKNKKYNTKEQINSFLQAKGKIFACGTCMQARKKKGSALCPISTLKDLLKIVEESDKLLTFG